MASDGQLVLTFSTCAGHSYRVEFKDNLGAAWAPLAGAVFATGQRVEISDPGPLPSQRYYRIAQLD